MPDGTLQNQILPFYFSDNLPDKTVLDFRHFQSEGFEVFVLSSLFSARVKNLEVHLNYALDNLVSNFDQSKEEILDRMKTSIFASGDKLADYLIGMKEPVDDVDYNVCFVAFKGGIVYVWIDGNIGVRMHRGNESLIINSKEAPQFFGSTTVELGDILEIAFAKDIKSNNSNVEEYVLEKSKPNYPGLFIDYQVENIDTHVVDEMKISIAEDNQIMATDKGDNSEEVSSNNVGNHSLDSGNEDEISNDDFFEKTPATVEEAVEKRRALSFDTNKAKGEISGNFDKLKENVTGFAKKVKNSGVFEKIFEYLKLGFQYIWQGLMALTSFLLDLVFGLVYSKNPHQFKRYQNSLKKKNLQHLLIFIIFLFVGYLLLLRPFLSGDNNSSPNNSGVITSDNTSKVRESLQSKFNLLQNFYTTSNVTQFNSTFDSLKSDIQTARNNGFSDAEFLNTLSARAQTFNDDLFKITPILKVDEAFISDDQNVSIVDFSTIGTDVYAINKAGGQVLKSNSTTQKFEIFASDKDLTSLTHISCIQTSCYLTDENLGLAILNLQTKTFSKFSALKDSGKGVKELQVFQVGNSVNIYALVPEQSKVVRYTRSGEGITPGVTWNKAPGFGPGTVDFAIDGGIFEMNSNGSLRRFFSGNPDPATTIGGLGTTLLPLGTDLQIATTPARNTAPGVINRMYVADRVNKRIVVYEKDPDASKLYPFKGSFVYRGSDKISFENINQISLSDDEKSLYVLSNNIVFRFSVSAI